MGGAAVAGAGAGAGVAGRVAQLTFFGGGACFADGARAAAAALTAAPNDALGAAAAADLARTLAARGSELREAGRERWAARHLTKCAPFRAPPRPLTSVPDPPPDGAC